MQQKIYAKEASMRPWTPPAHIITFGRYLDKHQKLFKAIGILNSDTDRIKDEVRDPPEHLKGRLEKYFDVFHHPLRHAKSVLRRPRRRKRIQ